MKALKDIYGEKLQKMTESEIVEMSLILKSHINKLIEVRPLRGLVFMQDLNKLKELFETNFEDKSVLIGILVRTHKTTLDIRRHIKHYQGIENALPKLDEIL